MDVEVIRNHFAPHKETEKEVFRHPSRLASHEMDRIRESLPKSLEHATSRVKDGGVDAIDSLGLGLMHSHESSIPDSPHSSQASSPWVQPRTDSPEPIRDGEGSGRSSSQPKPPAIKIDTGKKKAGLRQRLFGKSTQEPTEDVEQGRSASDPTMLTPYNTSRSRPVPITATSTEDSALDRSVSNRNTSIRFADNSTASSDTAPGLANYGVNAPGFKKTPGLAMFRSASVQSSGSARGEGGPSVSFQEPERPR